MGIDTKLFLNPKWELRDIITVLERTQGKKVKVKAFGESDSWLVGMFHLDIDDRMITIFVNHETPMGVVTYLSLSANEKAIKIFRGIAEVLGGLLQPEDTREIYEMIEGKLYDEDAMPYFAKYAILHDGVEPDDLKGILESIKKWYGEHSMSDKDDTIYQHLKELGIC